MVFQNLLAPFILEGIQMTLLLSLAAMLLGIVLGLLGALGRLSRFAAVRWLAGTYVWLVRGTPLLVQIIIFYNGLPQVAGIYLTPLQSSILALGINSGAYVTEFVRAGIISIDRGQMEAAKALGMTGGMAMRRIILPQATRVIIPPLGNEFNTMIKNTSLASVTSVMELLRSGQRIYSVTFRTMEILTVVTLYYLIMTTVWNVVQARIERRLARGYEASRPSVKGVAASA